MSLVLEDWRKRRFTFTQDGYWEAVRVFTVQPEPVDIGPFDEEWALVQAGVPQQGEGHPDNVFMLATAPTCPRDGAFNLFTITIPYKIVPYIATGSGGNPLNIPVRIRWAPSMETVNVDKDFNGNRIVNSAGDAPANGLPALRPRYQFSLLRNEATYTVSIMQQFIGAVNSSPWHIKGIGTVEAGAAMCMWAGPVADYQPNNAFIPIEYRFECRAEGWLIRFADVGRRCFYQPQNVDGGNISSSAGTIYDAGGDPASIDVLLDGRGGLSDVSRDAGYRVTKDLYPDADNPAGTPAGAQIDNGQITPGGGGGGGGPPTGGSSADATFLLYQVQPTADFNALGF